MCWDFHAKVPFTTNERRESVPGCLQGRHHVVFTQHSVMQHSFLCWMGFLGRSGAGPARRSSSCQAPRASSLLLPEAPLPFNLTVLWCVRTLCGKFGSSLSTLLQTGAAQGQRLLASQAVFSFVDNWQKPNLEEENSSVLVWRIVSSTDNCAIRSG